MSAKTDLKTVIDDCSEQMKKMEVGTPEYKNAGEVLAKLQAQYNELEKLEVESRDKEEQRETEAQLRREEMKADQKDKKIGYTLTFLGIAVPAGVAVWGALKSWKFEETGVVASATGRKFMDAILRFKK